MKNIFLVVLFVAVGFGIFKLFSQPNSAVSDKDAQLIMFWGDGCPHCEKVKQYVADNKLQDKIKISYKEVYYNKTNQQLLADFVKKCPEIDSKSGIGVPLAWDTINSKCLQGDQPIIDWLNSRVLK